MKQFRKCKLDRESSLRIWSFRNPTCCTTSHILRTCKPGSYVELWLRPAHIDGSCRFQHVNSKADNISLQQAAVRYVFSSGHIKESINLTQHATSRTAIMNRGSADSKSENTHGEPWLAFFLHMSSALSPRPAIVR